MQQIRVVFVGYAVSFFKLLNYEPNCCIEADNDIEHNLWPLSYIYSIFVCSGKFGGQLLSKYQLYSFLVRDMGRTDYL